MHWTKQVIALKANQRTLQIFDLAQKAKLQSATMNEDVLYWKWISSETLGLVTDTSVYHWNVFGNATSPQKVFDRNSNLSVCLHFQFWQHLLILVFPGLSNYQLSRQ